MDHNTPRESGSLSVSSQAAVSSRAAVAAAVRIEDNVTHNRFDLFVADELIGILGYRDADDGAIAFMHTVVIEDFGDRGWAGVLVRGALNTARDRGWRIVPICTYVRRYLARNPEFLDLTV